MAESSRGISFSVLSLIMCCGSSLPEENSRVVENDHDEAEEEEEEAAAVARAKRRDPADGTVNEAQRVADVPKRLNTSRREARKARSMVN